MSFFFLFYLPCLSAIPPILSLLLSPCARWEDPQTCFFSQALGRKIFLLFSLKSQALLQNIPHKCLRELRCFKGFHSSVCFLSFSLSLNLSLSFPVARTEKENTSTLPSWSETCWNNLIVLNLITKTSLWSSLAVNNRSTIAAWPRCQVDFRPADICSMNKTSSFPWKVWGIPGIMRP